MNPGTSGLERGLAVLEALAGGEAASRGGLGVVRLAELVGSDKSQTSRTLATLAEHGLVERDAETLAYRVGWQVYALAARAGEPRSARRRPASPARARARPRRERPPLGAPGASVLTLLSESPASAIHAPVAIGALTPLATTSAGRALAFDLEPEELGALGLAGDAERIEEARALGYAIVREEFEPGLVAAAAPVRDSGGRVVAAVNVSAPAFRFASRLDEAAAAVVKAAAELSADLGAPRQSAALGRRRRGLAGRRARVRLVLVRRELRAGEIVRVLGANALLALAGLLAVGVVARLPGVVWIRHAAGLPAFRAAEPVGLEMRPQRHTRDMNTHIAEVPNPEPPPHPTPNDPPPTASTEDDVKEREQEKLDIGDSHPADRDIRPKPTRQGDGLDVGDPHPAERDTEPRT